MSNCFLKTAREPADVTEAGSLFHKRGPATAIDGSSAAVIERGTNRRPELVGCRHTVNALISHDGHLESVTVLDRKSVSFTQQWCHVIKLSGARYETNSSILDGLQTAEIMTYIAVVQPRENKACNEHCTCETTPNASELSQDAKKD